MRRKHFDPSANSPNYMYFILITKCKKISRENFNVDIGLKGLIKTLLEISPWQSPAKSIAYQLLLRHECEESGQWILWLIRSFPTRTIVWTWQTKSIEINRKKKGKESNFIDHSMSKQKILPVEPLIQCEAGRAKTMQRQSLYSPRTPKWPPSDKGEFKWVVF